MRILVATLFALLLAAAPARAVDYAKIDRTLRKEPAYKSKAPQYALLLFGREADLRVWLVLDGEVAYLDRNGDGDLTGAGERFDKHADCKGIEIADRDGKTRYVITGIGAFPDGDRRQARLGVDVDVKGSVEYRQYCDAELRDSPARAAVAHFHGPLTAGPVTVAWKVPPQLALVAGDKPTDLRALVGTMSGDHGCWVVVRSHAGDKSAFPAGVCPVVEIEFPPKVPGGRGMKRRYQLDKFC